MESRSGDSRSFKIWLALDRFRSSRWGVLIYYGCLIGVVLAVGVAAVAINGNHHIALQARGAAAQAKKAAMKANDAAQAATRSLCLQKRGDVAQLRGARKFLREHPNGTVDFSRALILNAIRNDAVDVAALRDVRCRLPG